MRKIYPQIGYGPNAKLLPMIEVKTARRDLLSLENWIEVEVPLVYLIYHAE